MLVKIHPCRWVTSHKKKYAMAEMGTPRRAANTMSCR